MTSTRCGDGCGDVNSATWCRLHSSSTYSGTSSPLATTTAMSSGVNSRPIDAAASARDSPRRYVHSAAPMICSRNGWIRFMWPTWPTVGFSSASDVSTRLPPWRPPFQCSPSRS